MQTTQGINNAFVWARDNGFQAVQLPVGKYLIDKNNAINFCDNTTYGLYNCIFIKESNNLPKYNILLCDGIKM